MRALQTTQHEARAAHAARAFPLAVATSYAASVCMEPKLGVVY